MTEQGTRTPAQRSWNRVVNEANSRQVEAFVTLIAPAMARAEEVASDVRALAATVAELKGRMDEFIGQVYVDLTERIEALEPVCYDDHGSTVPCAEAPPIKVDWRESLEYQRDRAEADADDLEQIRSRVLPQSPGSAEAAPGSSCRECGHLRSEHFEMRWPEDPNHCLVEGCKCDYFCHQHVSPEPSFAVPPPGPENMVQRGGNPWRGRTTVEPSRRAAVDTEAVMKLVKQYGATCEMLGKDYLADTLLERESQFDSIRAMLEPHDAARLRETVRKTIGDEIMACYSKGAEMTPDTLTASVIRAIGGER